MDGWIKLHRQFLDWEWYADLPTKALFLHLLLKANHKPKQWQGQTINEGELITSINSLSEQTGLSIRETRTALHKLESTGEITKKATNKYTLVKVQNYGIYQAFDISERQTKDKQKTSKRQTKDNKQEYKELKNEKNIITSVAERTPALKKCPSVLLTEEQWDSLLDMLGQKDFDNYCENLQNYIDEGHKVHNCYKTILAWARKDREL